MSLRSGPVPRSRKAAVHAGRRNVGPGDMPLSAPLRPGLRHRHTVYETHKVGTIPEKVTTYVQCKRAPGIGGVVTP